MGKLDGKVVVVTGASRGIGAEIARLFAAEGGRVLCAARTLREGDHQLAGSLETTVAAIRAAGGEARALTANIAEPAECEKLIGAARETYGPIDVLVNNAALTYYLPTKDFPLNRWLRSWAVNFHAPFVLSQLALAEMIPRRTGAIVNISSGAAIGPGRGPYPDPAIGAAAGRATARRRRRWSVSRRASRPRSISTACRSRVCHPRRSCRRRAPSTIVSSRASTTRAARPRTSWRRRRSCSRPSRSTESPDA